MKGTGRRSVWAIAFGLGVLMLPAACGGAAQPDEEIERLRAEVQRLQAQNTQLAAELKAFRPPPPAASVAQTNASVGTLLSPPRRRRPGA